MSDVAGSKRILLSSFLASIGAPVVLSALAVATNVQSHGRADISTVFHYGLAIWMFSLIATLLAGVLMLAINKVVAGKLPIGVLAVLIGGALGLFAFVALPREAALTVAGLAVLTLVIFILVQRFLPGPR